MGTELPNWIDETLRFYMDGRRTKEKGWEKAAARTEWKEGRREGRGGGVVRGCSFRDPLTHTLVRT